MAVPSWLRVLSPVPNNSAFTSCCDFIPRTLYAQFLASPASRWAALLESDVPAIARGLSSSNRIGWPKGGRISGAAPIAPYSAAPFAFLSTAAAASSTLTDTAAPSTAKAAASGAAAGVKGAAPGSAQGGSGGGSAGGETVGSSHTGEGIGGGLRRTLGWMGAIILTAGAGAAGYTTYAFTLDETKQKVRSIAEAAHGQPWPTAAAAQALVQAGQLYVDLRQRVEDQIQSFQAPSSEVLLPPLPPQMRQAYTLVLDLDDTLIYTDWKRERGWRTFKRPGVDIFLEQMARHYEIVIFSDQLNMYVDPILERLDSKGCISHRLYRDATHYIHGKHMRDFSKLNRNPSHVIYISSKALDSTLQPENGLPVKPWHLETEDTVLLDLIPFLEFFAQQRPADARTVLASYAGLDIPTAFKARAAEYHRRMQGRRRLFS